MIPVSSLLVLAMPGWCAGACPCDERDGSRTSSAVSEQSVAENLVLVTIDGLRRQEVFEGAEWKLMNKQDGGVRDVSGLKERFFSRDRVQARKKLMPFLWETVASRGQILGDPTLGSEAKCSNRLYFSYPGYNELLTGKADPAITSNAKRWNPNLTVLEWFNRQPDFGGVAAFCSWDVFPYIINRQRSGVYVNAGWEKLTTGRGIRTLNEVQGELPQVWPNVRFDTVTFRGAMAYLETKKPRVLYIAFGETDDWAHDGRYDLYLDAASRTDASLRSLWEKLQTMEQYAGKTTLLITTDHGRGEGREGWKNHSTQLAGSDKIWFAAIGPGVAPLGNRQSIQLTQAQYAATAASLLGMEFKGDGVAAAIDFSQPPASKSKAVKRDGGSQR